jgi:hypothetical protein
MSLPQDFYIFPEDLFRAGNSTEPRLTHIRADDINLDDVNGVPTVRLNNKGVSVFSLSEIKSGSASGWAWKIKKGTQLPPSVKLHNDFPGHYMICPTKSMSLSQYKGILEEMALKAEKAFKVEKKK